MSDRYRNLSDFQVLSLKHKQWVDGFLRRDRPVCSELNFSNLFIWRHAYQPVAAEFADCLVVACLPQDGPAFGFPPVGDGDKAEALDRLTERLREKNPQPEIRRIDGESVAAYVDPGKYEALPDPDMSDYVYRTEDLVNLAGRKYHQKKNHLNQFRKRYEYTCRELDAEIVECVLDMQENWCQMKNCDQNPDLLSEDRAVFEALTHYQELDYRGLAIIVDENVEAFSVGEPLNTNTAVVHIEKANPEIRGLYAAINQMACERLWAGFEFVNREQDLGVEGLRRAKESYNPHHMVDKFVLRPRGG